MELISSPCSEASKMIKDHKRALKTLKIIKRATDMIRKMKY